MVKINKHGDELVEKFISKTTIRKDIKDGTFTGTWKYEENIKSIEDAVGWMLTTYDYEAINVIKEWIEMDDISAWGFDLDKLQKELDKCFDCKGDD